MTVIAFAVPGEPAAQPRHRHRIAGKWPKQFVHSYIPEDHPIHDFKARVRKAFLKAYSESPLEGPVVLTVTFLMPRPQAICWRKKPTPRLRHTGVPDTDNLVKGLKDALTWDADKTRHLAWIDDSQVSEEHVRKLVCSGLDQPGALVKIASVEAEDVGWVFPRKLPAVCPRCCAKAVEIGVAVAGSPCEACTGLFAEMPA